MNIVKKLALKFLTLNRIICYWFFRVFCPVKKNRIYFVSNFGNVYSCNPRAFFEYLYKNHKNEFEFYYCANNDNLRNLLPNDVKTATYKTVKDYYYLATSKYIVNNFRFHKFFRKRKNQIYVQTWHGGPIPMKAVERAVEDRLNPIYVKEAKNDGKYIDIFCVGSTDIQKLYKEYFWCAGEIANIGTPRYDSVINCSKQDVKNAKQKVNVPVEKKLILIAPTFKEKKSWKEDILDNKKIINFFKEKFNEDVIVGYRFHPHLAEKMGNEAIDDAINLTNIDNSDDVVLASDIIISDFSSIVVDGMLAGKKCFCYSPSFDDYLKNDRSLWIDFDKLPFRFCKTESEMFEEFGKHENTKSKTELKQVYKNFGITENGNACENLYNYIKDYERRKK